MVTESQTDRSVDTLRAGFDDLRRRIESQQMRDDPSLKTALMDLYRTVDTSLADLTQLKDDIKQLVEAWKTRRNVTPDLAPQFTGRRPVVHEDHIGASTFLEKGWSKISVGDYEGAEESLIGHGASTDQCRKGVLCWMALRCSRTARCGMLNFQQVLAVIRQRLARINVDAPM